MHILMAADYLNSKPLVSIGMPAYNCEGTIRAAITGLLTQIFQDFELIISDNASEDGTGVICQEYARQDARIQYVRHPHNCGAPANFQFVLDKARGDFFMWAATDDLHSPDFVQHNLDFLKIHPDFVASVSPVRFSGGTFNSKKMGDASLTGIVDQRICDFFCGWHANGRYYSLMRRSAMQGCNVVGTAFLGSDWAVVLHLIREGKLNRSEQGWLELGTQGTSRSRDIFRIYRKTALDFFFPLARLSRFTWNICRDIGTKSKTKVALELMRLNLLAFASQLLIRLRRPAKTN